MVKAKQKVDRVFLFLVLGLFACGLFMLYSASVDVSFRNFDTGTYYFTHQLLYGGILGLAALYIFSKIDYRVWLKYAPLIVLAGLILLVMVKVPGLGYSAGGATRWVHAGPIVFQPAELAKLAVVLYIAALISKRSQKIHDFYYGVFPALAIVGVYAFLILLQPDVGSMLIIIASALAMLYAGGIRMKHFFWIIAVGLAALGVVIKLEPYRMQRLITFLNPSFDKLGISYQINQALLAIGSGGLLGYGYGNSKQKHAYLPEPIGDSIFAIMAEELGLLRISAILVLFIAFALKGFRISMAAPDLFGRMLGTGLVITITIQSVVNIGAILGILPLTGVTLPFFSYGSSSLITTLAACGILLNISRQKS